MHVYHLYRERAHIQNSSFFVCFSNKLWLALWKKSCAWLTFYQSALARPGCTRGGQCACSGISHVRCQFRVNTPAAMEACSGSYGLTLYFRFPWGWVLGKDGRFRFALSIVGSVCLYPSTHFPLFMTGWSLELSNSSDFFMFTVFCLKCGMPPAKGSLQEGWGARKVSNTCNLHISIVFKQTPFLIPTTSKSHCSPFEVSVSSP